MAPRASAFVSCSGLRIWDDNRRVLLRLPWRRQKFAIGEATEDSLIWCLSTARAGKIRS